MIEDLDQALAKPRLLAALEGDYAPRRHGRDPFWRAPMPPVTDDKRNYRRVIPGWRWESPRWDEFRNVERIEMDANAAWLSAASGVRLGWGALKVHRVGVDAEFTGKPGYYLVRVYSESWTDTHLPNPLGLTQYGSPWDGFVWMTHHTLDLIRWLHAQDAGWGVPTVHESWTAEHAVSLQEWTQYVNSLRAVALTRGDTEAMDRLKLSYAQAIQMLPGSEKSNVRRPDWFDAIISRHAAETFRKMYRAREAHITPLRMEAVDAVVFTSEDVRKLMAMEKKPFRVDQTGLTLGAFKVKSVIEPGADE